MNVKDYTGKPYEPSQVEIEMLCKEIRAKWTDLEFRKRGPLENKVLEPLIRVYPEDELGLISLDKL